MEYIRSYFHTPTGNELNSSMYITWAGHRVCTPQHTIGPRILDNYKIVLVLKGSGIFRQADEEFIMGPGDIFVLFPGVKHFYCANPADPWEIVWVSFNGKLCEDAVSSLNLTPESPVIIGGGSYRIVELMKNIIDGLEGVGELYALKSTGYLYILFSELLSLGDRVIGKRVHNPEQDCIKKALAFVDLNYYNNINVDILCSHVNFSRSYFSRLFKREVGLSIPEHINNVRIQKSKDLLKSTSLNINEVAKSVGFEDQFYFSRVFKKIVGISPINYRKGK